MLTSSLGLTGGCCLCIIHPCLLKGHGWANNLHPHTTSLQERNIPGEGIIVSCWVNYRFQMCCALLCLPSPLGELLLRPKSLWRPQAPNLAIFFPRNSISTRTFPCLLLSDLCLPFLFFIPWRLVLCEPNLHVAVNHSDLPFLPHKDQGPSWGLPVPRPLVNDLP